MPVRLSQIAAVVNLGFEESGLTNTVKQNRTNILSTPNSTPRDFNLESSTVKEGQVNGV